MRLIDADELKATEKRISSIPWGDEDGNRVENSYTPEEVQRMIDHAPTVKLTVDLISRQDVVSEIDE